MEINELPDEVLLLIFGLLPPLQLGGAPARVCQRWRGLISSRVLVLHTARQLEQLQAGLGALLAVRRVPALCGPSALLARVAARATRLTHLTLLCELALDENDYTILSTLEHLQHLDVFSKKRVLFRHTSVPSSVTCLVVNNNMSNGFLPMLCHENKIRGFHMYGGSLYYSPREMVRFIGVHSTHLTELTLRCTEMTDIRYKVLDECGALRSLRLYSCWLLTSKGVPYLCRPKLRCLHLTGARMVRSRALLSLVAALPGSLQELNVSCSWFGAEHAAAAARLAGLRVLEAWRCGADGAALVRLALRLPRLRRLDTDARLSTAQLTALQAHWRTCAAGCRRAGAPRGRYGCALRGRRRERCAGTETDPARTCSTTGQSPDKNVFHNYIKKLLFIFVFFI